MLVISLKRGMLPHSANLTGIGSHGPKTGGPCPGCPVKNTKRPTLSNGAGLFLGLMRSETVPETVPGRKTNKKGGKA